MLINAVREIWASKSVVLNGWLSIANSFSAELMAHAGWNSICIDLQHGIIDYGGSIPMLQAISTTKVTPFARVPWNDPPSIMKMLDAGAQGIICPMISTAEEAERFVASCTYPPRGFRSHGPTRAVVYAGSDYPIEADGSIVKLAMIETEGGVANLDAILAVPGLDGVYIGPADLGRALGRKAMLDQTDPVVVSAIEDIVRRTRAAGLHAGIHTGSASYARKMVSEGCDFVTILSDARLLATAAEKMVKEFSASADEEIAPTAPQVY
mgnify:CR=1 FL=1